MLVLTLLIINETSIKQRYEKPSCGELIWMVEDVNELDTEDGGGW